MDWQKLLMLILSKLNFCTYYQIDKKSPKNDQINQIYSQLIVKLLEYKSWQHPIQVPYHDARITSSTPAGPHALHVSKDKVLHYMAPPNQVFYWPRYPIACHRTSVTAGTRVGPGIFRNGKINIKIWHKSQNELPSNQICTHAFLSILNWKFWGSILEGEGRLLRLINSPNW